jgi:hypothetical protein
MTRRASGLLSELVLVRMHGRAAQYLAAGEAERPAVVGACRREATVQDLAERIVSRTIYSQASSRVGPLRELIQNALDASPRGARIDLRTSETQRELTIADRGRGMSRTELLEDLLVPFRSGKEGEPESIGEHGVGFLSALELAPRIRIVSVSEREGSQLSITPVGWGPPFPDFAWTLEAAPPAAAGGTGTVVELDLAEPLAPATIWAEVSAAASLVDPGVARIYVDDALVNAARARMRLVARIALPPEVLRQVLRGGGGSHLELYVGRGEGIPAWLTVTQKGLLVSSRKDAFGSVELSLQRDLYRAITSAGYGIVADLPVSVPLNKGRSAVAAAAAFAVEGALVAAFERFVLEDALHDRELLRGVDHRLSSVLDRLVASALAGEPEGAAEPIDELAATQRVPVAPVPPTAGEAGEAEEGAARTPTVAAPQEVVRFADGLMDAALLTVWSRDQGAARCGEASLRDVLKAYRGGVLRAASEVVAPGFLYLALTDPLAQALWRRLSQAVAPPAPEPARAGRSISMPRISRERLVREAASLPGASALSAAMTALEQIDAAIARAVGIGPSPISVHQDLYGPDEMAHTDGTGISVNLASPRVRTLLHAVLAADDPAAFGALVDLLLHEKAHVSLASYAPRPMAEHGATFYRRKDWLRRRLLQALAAGEVADPIRWLPVIRRGLSSIALPSPEALARTFAPGALAA